jgi:hypothetical protein
MVVKFASLRIKPTLKLAFKGLLFAFLVLFVDEYHRSPFAILVFIAATSFLYFRPRLNSLKFAASFIALTAAPFILPPLPIGKIATAIALGVTFMLFLGIKNLVLVLRDKWYAIVHTLILVIYSAALFSSSLRFFTEAGAFVLFFLLFREFYYTMSILRGPRLVLSSALQSLVAIELLWVLRLLPIGFIASSAIFTLTLFIFFDVFLHHLSGHLSRKLILRDGTILILSTLVIMASSGWSLAG